MKRVLDNIKIPPLPQSVIEIEAIVNSSDFEISKMADIINKDSILVAYVLKSANSPLYGFSRIISSVNTAISMFGKQEVKAWVYSVIMRASFDREIYSYGITSEILAELSEKQGAFAKKWAEIEFPALKDKISFFAFMMELGKIPLSITLQKEGLDKEFLIRFNEANSQEKVLTLEKELAKASSSEFSSFLFDKWNMDTDLVNVMKFVDSPETAEENLLNTLEDSKLAMQLAKIAKILYIVKNIFSLKPLSDVELNDILDKAKYFGFNKENIMQVLNKMTVSEWDCFFYKFRINIKKFWFEKY